MLAQSRDLSPPLRGRNVSSGKGLLMALDIKSELLGITQALDNVSIPYAVCGGLAVAIHGFPRFTDDVDLLLLEDDLQPATRALAPLGFTLSSGIIPFRFGTPEEMRLYRVSKASGSDLLTLDLILVTPFIRPIWESRQLVSFEDRTIQVVSRDGLISMKEAADRAIDRIDLIRLRGEEE